MNEPEIDDDQPEPQGCLAWILNLFGIKIQPEDVEPAQELPYRLTQKFLTPAELSFYKVVKQVVPADFVIMAKPRLLDVLYVPKRTKGKWAFENKIRSKHFDFVICEVQTMTPRLVIELDDKSHQRSDRQERDTFVDDATAAAGLQMMHVTARASYVPNELRTQIQERLKFSAEPMAAKSDPSGVPICPKCGEAMVERVAGRGANKGGKFWGCPNYPDCRETVQ